MPEDRNGTIADNTSADSTLPISFLALQAKVFGTGAGSQNDGVRGLRHGHFWMQRCSVTGNTTMVTRGYL